MDNSMNLDGATGVYSKYSNKYVGNYVDSDDTSSGSYMDFDSYLQLLVAQMQNQDFNDPMSDSEVLAQMAQYSMLEGIKNMTQQSNQSYAMSLVGKAVTINLGQSYITGNVDSVTIVNGEPLLMINGNAYKTSEVTDIVDPQIFEQLKSMVGKTVKTLTVNEEDSITGKVTGYLFLYGESYVVVNGEPQPLRYVEIVEDKDDSVEGSEGAEGSEGTEGSESAKGSESTEGSGEVEKDDEAGGTDGTENAGSVAVSASSIPSQESDDKDQYSLESAQAKVSNISTSYLARSQALVDVLMKELDGISEVSETNKAELDSTDYYIETAYLTGDDIAAGALGDIYYLPNDGSESTTVSSGSVSTIPESGVLVNNSSIVNVNTTYGNGTITVTANLDPNTAERTSNGNLKGVTTAQSVSTSDCVPHRISVEAYPEEAALADQLGTRMYDIRFINNHAVTSRISTEVIGRTVSGRGITEIGYSGVGQLGEVVTFDDGTQRVEVLLSGGRSGWLVTSGNYTIDEICNKNAPAGSLSDLTPAEKSIRHFSDPDSKPSKASMGLA